MAPAQDRREEPDRDDPLALGPRLEGSPLVGKPLPSRVRLNRITLESYLASSGGPLPYMRRLRMIEDEFAAIERDLDRAWRRLAAEADGDGDRFARRWSRLAARWSFGFVNGLIDKHNAYYPAEARLPMDPRTGDFVRVNGEPYWKRHLDARWVLERFPPLLAAAVDDAAA